MKTVNPEDRCAATAYHGDASTGTLGPCQNRGKYIEDGLRLCGIHSQTAKYRRRARADEAKRVLRRKFDYQNRQRQAANNAAELLTMLERVTEHHDDGDGHCELCAEAVALIEGLAR